MIDIQSLSAQIKQNCNISDARHWGYYSLCGLLLKLRDLYRLEKGLRLWEKVDQKDIGEWITKRENLWRELEDADFGKIAINGNVFDPFEVARINDAILREGLVYGAGFGIHMKPSFFLADILSRRNMNGFTVCITGREYARDLSDYPAMLQGDAIFARADSIKHLIWNRFEELKCKKSKCALAFAFSKYGIAPEDEPSEDIDKKIEQVALSEAETYVYHEVGEAMEGKRIGEEWKNLLTSLTDGRAEIFARAVKDILSDTSEHGMLKHIIENRKEGSLGFHMVFLGGMRKTIFPEIFDAFQQFLETGDWGIIEQAQKTGYRKAGEYAERLLSIYRRLPDRESLLASIESEILKGLL